VKLVSKESSLPPSSGPSLDMRPLRPFHDLPAKFVVRSQRYLRRGVQLSVTPCNLSAMFTLNRFERSSAPTRALCVERAAAREGRGLTEAARGEAWRTVR